MMKSIPIQDGSLLLVFALAVCDMTASILRSVAIAMEQVLCIDTLNRACWQNTPVGRFLEGNLMPDFAQYIGSLDFDSLIVEADMLSVGHDEQYWLDDEWPDREDDLRVAVIDALHKKLAKAQEDTE